MKGSTKSIIRFVIFSLALAIALLFKNHVEVFFYSHLILTFSAVLLISLITGFSDNSFATGLGVFLYHIGVQLVLALIRIGLAILFSAVFKVSMFMVYGGVTLVMIFIPALKTVIEPNKYD